MEQPTLIFKIPSCNLECTLTQHKNGRWKFSIANPRTRQRTQISRSFDTLTANAIVNELLHGSDHHLTTDFAKNASNLKGKVAHYQHYSRKHHPHAKIRNRRQKGRIRPCRN